MSGGGFGIGGGSATTRTPGPVTGILPPVPRGLSSGIRAPGGWSGFRDPERVTGRGSASRSPFSPSCDAEREPVYDDPVEDTALAEGGLEGIEGLAGVPDLLGADAPKAGAEPEEEAVE